MLQLSRLRKQKGLKQGELANFLGVAQSTLSGWENGKFEIDDKNKIKLADFFGVSVDYLLGRETSSARLWAGNDTYAPRKEVSILFSYNLKALRKRVGLTQVELARKLHVANGTIAMWETGKREPNFETIQKIAEIFDVSIDDLIGNHCMDNRLRQLRIKSGLSQKELADRLYVNQTAVSQLERGITTPNQNTLIKLCDMYGVTIDYILGYSPDIAPRKKGVKIPVLGRVAAGIPVEAVQDVIDYEEIDEEMAKTGDFFALQIKGDSMEPKISSGDVVIVRKQDVVDSGDIAIVMVNGDDATCKKFVKHKNGVSLVSMNPAYTPMFYTMDEVESLPVRVLGRVMELRAKF